MNALVLALLVAGAGIRPFPAMRDPGIRAQAGSASVTIDAPAYTRTVTASSYTLTGTSSGSGAVTWSASPSGDSGACTGTDTFSCVVTVTPNSVGEGVEVITVTRGTATDTETLGFYVQGAHSAFLSQNVNGSYNVGLANNDAVSTWENVGTSALDVTQAGAGTLKPTFRTNIVSGQPMVSCDGGDYLTASTASDWTFLNNGTDWSVDYIKVQNTTSLTAHIVSTRPNGGLAYGAVIGDLTGSETLGLVSNSSNNVLVTTSGAYNTVNKIHGIQYVLDDDGGAGVDFTGYTDGTSRGTGSRSGSYSSTAPGTGVRICASGGGGAADFLNGYLFSVLVYQSALTATQRGINEAVNEWAIGGPLPRNPFGLYTEVWMFVGDSITEGTGGVVSYPAKLSLYAPATTLVYNAAVGGDTSASILGQWTAEKNDIPNLTKVFILGGVNDIAYGGTAATAYASLSQIYSEAAAMGIEVIAMPTPPFGNSGLWSAPDQVQIEALEALIIADGNVDLVVNWYDLMGQGGSPEDLAAAYDIGDGIHMNATGTTFMADTLKAALGL